MRWIFCGGRRFRLGPMGRAVMAAIHRPDAHPWLGGLLRRLQAIEPRIRPGIDAVYEGEAEGVDLDARGAAEQLGIPVIGFPYASEHGKAGGPIRNLNMLTGNRRNAGAVQPAEAVLAAAGGTGTANMVAQARGAGIPVVDIADPVVTTALASYQRWTKDDAWLVRSDRRRVLEVHAGRPGVGPPIMSGHWMKVNGKPVVPAWCTYVGRDAHGLAGHPLLHNPFPVRPLSADQVSVLLPGGAVICTRERALDYYREHLGRILPMVRAELAAVVLQRRVLVCWCGDAKPCHACVIAEAAVEVVAEGCFEVACRASTGAGVGGTATA